MMLPEESPDAISKVAATGLKSNHFYKQAHRTIYKAILNLYEKGEPADLLTVTKELERTGDLEKAGGTQDIDEMIDSVPSAANVEYYAQMVLDGAERRKYIRDALEIYDAGFDDSLDIDEMRSKVQKLTAKLPGSKDGPKGMPEPATELIRAEIADPPMIISDGLLPAFGYTMLGAVTKTGKTTLAVQMALSVGSGTDFLGFPVERHIKVLYCYLEGTRASMSKLIRQQLDGWGGRVDIDNLVLLECRGLSFESKNCLRWLKKQIADTNAGLVILDPIGKTTTRDINRLENITAFVNKLEEITDYDAGICWLLLHHFGKPTVQKREPIQKLHGSSGWGNYTESFIGIERYSERRSPDYKKLTFYLRHGPNPGDICTYLNPGARLFEIVESPEAIPSLNAERVRDILREHGKPARFTLLRTLVEMQLGVSERQAAEAIVKAKKAGIISKGENRYDRYTIEGMNSAQDTEKILHL